MKPLAEISRAQRVCILAFAALFGSLSMGGFTTAMLMDSSGLMETLGARREWQVIASGCLAFACNLVFVMLMGAWLGAAVCVLWRSPPGTRVFWALSGGVLGGILALGGASWTFGNNDSSSREPVAMSELLTLATVTLVGTLAGLVIGCLIGRRRSARSSSV